MFTTAQDRPGIARFGLTGILVVTACLGFAVPALLGPGLALAGPDTAGGEPEVYYPPDVVGQFKALTDRAEALGWPIGDSPDPSMCYHYQGVARTHGRGTPYMFLSKSGNQPDTSVPCVQWCSDAGLPCTQIGDGPGSILIVRMGSRDGNGERLRSNRLRHDRETADSYPDPLDVPVGVIYFGGQDGWPFYGHPGSIKIIGDVLVVPLEKPYADDPSINRVLFVDISDPENPLPMSSLVVPTSSGFTVGVVAITTFPDGRYLMLVTGEENKLVKVYESVANRADGSTDLLDSALSWIHVDDWRPEDEPVDPPCIAFPPSPQFPDGYRWGWPGGSFDDFPHQSLTLLREGGPYGPLFMIGARDSNAAPLLGEDRLDLYGVTWDGLNLRVGCVAQRHLHTFPSSDGARVLHHDLANFAAATGFHVTPGGELILYATEHDNDGPGGTVKAGEWRRLDMVRPDSPTLDPTAEAGGPYSVPEGSSILLQGEGGPPATKAWMQLWADPDYDDRYVVIDYDDRFDDDFDDFVKLDDAKLNPFDDGFEDQASSLRYFAPVGCTLRVTGSRFIIENNVPVEIPVVRTLPGSGAVVKFDDLDDVNNEVERGDLDDAIDSAEFLSDCDTYYTIPLDVDWDLDDDGQFETAGAGPAFFATTLDGPSTVDIALRARHPLDARTAIDAATVEITNVPPAITEVTVTDDLGRPIEDGQRPGLTGLPLTLTGRFTDPGQPDTHTASIDWGDGAATPHPALDAFSPATGGVIGSAQAAHRYTVPGTYVAALAVQDDDGDGASQQVTLRILDPADLLAEIAGDLEEWLDSLTDQEAIRALTDALRAIIGNRSGDAANGALDKLEADNLNAMMAKLRDAVDALDRAEEATGLSFDEQQGSLALTALAIATAAYDAADAFIQPPSDQQSRRLANASTALDLARAALAASDFGAALDALGTSVQLTTALLTGAS